MKIQRNQGQWLEKEITTIADAYEVRGTMRLKKASPPSIVVYKPVPRVIMLENPYLDYIGTWTARGGRGLCIEAKSTEKPTLGICQDGGITERQYSQLHLWEQAGAAVGVLWGYQAEIRFIALQALTAQIHAGVKNIKWDAAKKISARPRVDHLGVCGEPGPSFRGLTHAPSKAHFAPTTMTRITIKISGLAPLRGENPEGAGMREGSAPSQSSGRKKNIPCAPKFTSGARPADSLVPSIFSHVDRDGIDPVTGRCK